MKSIICFAICIISYAFPFRLHAQIEVHDGGKVDIGGNGFIIRPSCHTFIRGSSSGVNNTLQVTHTNTAAFTEGITTELPNTSTVSYEIHVMSNPGVFYVTGAGDIFYAGGSWITSDSSTKKNIRELSDPLSRIRQLNGYTYHKKNFMISKGLDSGKTFVADTSMHEGLMADQVEKIAPYMVKEMANGKKAVDYVQLIPLLVESIKELDRQNEKKADEIALLNARYNKLASDLDTTGGKYLLKQSTNTTNYILYQNTPNPFNKETSIGYSLKSSYSSAYIFVFDLQGSLKKTFQLSSANSSVTIKASDLTAGMYLYSLVVDGKEVDTKRMILTN